MEEKANEYQVCRIRKSPSKSMLDVDPKDIFAGGRESVLAKNKVLGALPSNSPRSILKSPGRNSLNPAVSPEVRVIRAGIPKLSPINKRSL